MPDYLAFTYQYLIGVQERLDPFFLYDIMMTKTLPKSDQGCYWVLTVCEKLGKTLSIRYSVFICTTTPGGRCRRI